MYRINLDIPNLLEISIMIKEDISLCITAESYFLKHDCYSFIVRKWNDIWLR
jgi:hypothetical protein